MARNYKVIEKIINGKKYRCIDPLCCVSPIPTRVTEILYDTEEYVIAEIYYRKSKTPSIGFRWNLVDYEMEHYGDTEELCLGYPNTRGYATWFVLPKEFGDFALILNKKKNIVR